MLHLLFVISDLGLELLNLLLELGSLFRMLLLLESDDHLTVSL